MERQRSEIPQKVVVVRILGGAMLLLFGISFAFFYETLFQQYKIIWVCPFLGGFATYKKEQYPVKKNVFLVVLLGIIGFSVVCRMLWLLLLWLK